MQEQHPHIIVPIDLKAFMVNAVNADRWKDMRKNYRGLRKLLGSGLDKGDLFSDKAIKNKPIAGEDVQPKDIGIHLHWTLPKALAHGLLYKGELDFPAVPDRWLVLRIQKEQEQLKHKAWIIESDYTDRKEGTSNWLEWTEKEGYQATKIGRAIPYEDWVETGEEREQLSAIAPGNPTFSADYRSCQNVFGFHDELSDLDVSTTHTLSYLVSGWYANEQSDPLSNQSKGDQALRKLRREDIYKRWKIEGKDWEEASFQTLCHAALHQVKWANNEDKTNPAKKAAVNMAAGNTALEGLSARLSQQTGVNEKILSAFQYDLLKEVKTVDEVKAEIHKKGFDPIDGGTLWEIEATEENKDKKQNGQALTSFPPADFFASKEQFKQLKTTFHDLLKDQRSLDNKLRERNAWQVNFRAAWDRNILDEKEQETTIINYSKSKVDSLNLEIIDLEEKLKKHPVKINELLGYREEKHKDSEGQELIKVFGKYRLSRKKMPSFWQTPDPALLFSGPGIDRAQQYRKGASSSHLPCRLSTQLIDQLQLKGENLLKTWTNLEKPNSIPDFPLSSKDNMPHGIQESLYYELLLMDSSWAKELAQSYFSQIGRPDDPNVQYLTDAIHQFLDFRSDSNAPNEYRLSGFASAEGGAVDLSSPSAEDKQKYFHSIAHYQWQAPWSPLFLLWQVEWFPDYSKPENQWQFNFDNWKWNGKDYQWDKEKTIDTSDDKKIILEGQSLLSTFAQDLLKDKLSGFKKVDQINLLAQTLEGFSDRLLMRQQAIRLPLLEKRGKHIFRKFGLEEYESDAEYFLPGPDMMKEGAPKFFPVRAGHLKIRQLWLVDTFGQIQQIAKFEDQIDTEEDTTYSGTPPLAAVDYKSAKENILTLAPRMTEPARLLLRWMSADHAALETNSNPASSPVFGWLLYNRIDDSLWVYNQAGAALGELFYQSGKESFGWRKAPGSNTDSGAESMESSVENETLLQFLQELKATKGSWKALKQTIEQIDANFGAKKGQPNRSLAQRIGQPLALVKAAVQLESYGIPAYPQTSEAQLKKTKERKAYGMEDLEFSLSLGNIKHRKDGLVGYFVEQNFSQMHLCHGVEKQQNSYFAEDDLHLKINAPTRGLTVLLDPRGGLSARTGLLPEKRIDLPHELLRKHLESMACFLRTAPVLGSIEDLQIPVPRDPNGNWVWYAADREGAWDKKELSSEEGKKKVFEKLELQEGFLKIEKSRK